MCGQLNIINHDKTRYRETSFVKFVRNSRATHASHAVDSFVIKTPTRA